MNRVENSTNAAQMVRELSGYSGLLPVSGAARAEHGASDRVDQGALAMARTAVREVLASSGFVDLTGPQQRNLEVYLTRSPVGGEIEDLKPGLLTDLEAWVRSHILGDAQQALQVQANVPAEGAIKLLT